MNLLLLEGEEVGEDGCAELTGRRAEHLARVLKVEIGQGLRVGIIEGAQGRGEVLETDGPRKPRVRLRIELGDPPPSPLPVDLVVGMSRPQAFKRILQVSAAMGVRRLDFVNAWRVEKSFFSSPALAPEAVRRQLLLGAEQGGTTRLPEVRFHRLLMPFLEAGEESTAEKRARLIAHPRVTSPLEKIYPGGGPTPVQVALGPEGGWIDREVGAFEEAGFSPVALGPWVLRVETAVVCVLSQVELLRRGSGAAEEA